MKIRKPNIFLLSLFLVALVIVPISLSLYGQSILNYFYKIKLLIEPLVISTPLDLSEENESKTSLFYGVNVEMSQLLPASQNYIVNDDGEDLIDIAFRLGINMFRITNGTLAFSNLEPIYSKEQWESVLDKMHNKNIQALILIESPTIYQRNISTEYLDFVQVYAIDSGVLLHPAVFGIDLYNEPVIDNQNVKILRTAAERIRSRYPEMRLTVGWWAVDNGEKDENNETILKWNAYSEGRVFEDFVDFYSLHMYGFDNNENILQKYPDPYVFTRNFITQVKGDLKTQKPLLIEEFGAANGDAVSDQESVGSPELQANTYAGVYQVLNDLKDPQVLGSVSYQFYQRSDTADAWAILKDKGNYLYPAAYVLQKYAKVESDALLLLPFKPVPTSYLVTNDDDGRRINLKVSDTIGIKLSLNPKNMYKVFLSDDSLFSVNQKFFYDSMNEEHRAVFKATARGKQILVIHRCDDSKCTTSEKIFSVFFSVE